MQVDAFVERYPLLFHMAEEGSWPSIKRHGLLSTSALIRLYALDAEQRRAIEATHRPENITVTRDGLPPAVVRDQKPLNMKRLAGCLTDMTPTEWLQHLNRRVFFWTSENRLRRLLGARPYRGLAHDVLTVETASLVDAYVDRITLAPYNTGATMPIAVPRGGDTFRSIADYPFEAWCRKRPMWDAVVEVAVDDGVEDIEAHMLRVERRCGLETLSTVWKA